MFGSVDDLYLSFRDGIRRTKQTTVPKIVFKRIWNEWALNQWIKNNLSFVEGASLTQKQEDDLQSLRVITDGVYVYNYSGDVLYPLAPDTGLTNIYTVPISTSVNNYGAPYTPAIQRYPIYKRAFNLWFLISGTWVKSRQLKVIDENFIINSQFSSPSITMPYHRFRNNKIECMTGGIASTALRLDYIREPNQVGYTASTDTLSYTLDLGQDQLEEIRNLSVRLYLERVQDPRWQSFFQEDMLKQISQK